MIKSSVLIDIIESDVFHMNGVTVDTAARERALMRINVFTAGTVALALGSVFLAAGCQSESGEEVEGEIAVGVSIAASSVAVSLGVDEGYFSDEGLDVEVSQSASPPARIAAVQSGAVDVVELPTPAFIGAVEKGIDLKVIAAQYGYPDDVDDTSAYEGIDVMVGADSEVERARDLEGKKVGVPAREDLMELLVTNVVTEDGGDPTTIEWVVLDFTSQVAALGSGRIDAVVVPLPFNLKVLEAGGRSIAHPAGEFFGAAPTTVWVASSEVYEDAELLHRIQRAIHRSNTFANDHHDAVTAKAAELTTIPIEVLNAAQARYYFPTAVSAALLQETADRMMELGFLDGPVDVAAAVSDQNFETED